MRAAEATLNIDACLSVCNCMPNPLGLITSAGEPLLRTPGGCVGHCRAGSAAGWQWAKPASSSGKVGTPSSTHFALLRSCVASHSCSRGRNMSVATMCWAAFDDRAPEPDAFCLHTIVHKTVSAPNTLETMSVSLLGSIDVRHQGRGAVCAPDQVPPHTWPRKEAPPLSLLRAPG